jgi:hypothetical protein
MGQAGHKVGKAITGKQLENHAKKATAKGDTENAEKYKAAANKMNDPNT